MTKEDIIKALEALLVRVRDNSVPLAFVVAYVAPSSSDTVPAPSTGSFVQLQGVNEYALVALYGELARARRLVERLEDQLRQPAVGGTAAAGKVLN